MARTPLPQGVTVVIPTHQARHDNGMLDRALDSVRAQTRQPDAVIVETDISHAGAAATRERGLNKAATRWTAFLDSDDEWMPQHLERLLARAEETGADYVYSWFVVNNGILNPDLDPLGYFGQPWDPEHPHDTTMTILVRTELAQQMGFIPARDGDLVGGEDRRFTDACNTAGAKIVHLPEKTWIWHWHGRNTSGLPHRGDAATAGARR
jgi:glycosyltransferase involved in cell wall biosynthesis